MVKTLASKTIYTKTNLLPSDMKEVHHVTEIGYVANIPWWRAEAMRLKKERRRETENKTEVDKKMTLPHQTHTTEQTKRQQFRENTDPLHPGCYRAAVWGLVACDIS